MSKWYYLSPDDKKMGPFEDSEFGNIIKHGGCNADSMVSRSGDGAWQPLGEIEELTAHIQKAEFPDGKANVSQLPPVQLPRTLSVSAAYLYVSPYRLVFLSIFSCGLYEIYWMYANWRFLKKRDKLDIIPGIRAIFGVFFCHSLFNTIYDDSALSRSLKPAFYPNVLATLWIIMLLISFLMVDIEGAVAEILSYLVPRFLCFLPVQSFINSGNKEMRPRVAFKKIGTGDIVCFLFGLLVWGDIVVSLIRS